jgi:predicted solute-binding protein
VNDSFPRIGCVPYLNARPLVEGITYPIRKLVPSKLGDAFQAREFDAALLSSIDVITAPIPCAVDGVSISSKGDVYSVVLAYQGDLKGIKKVVHDPASHTSNALLRIVLEEFHGIYLEYVQSPETKHLDFFYDHPTLLIGDRALEVRKRTSALDVHFLDLGGEWYRNTSLPFIFALWALRDDFTKKSELSNLLRTSKVSGLAKRQEIAAREQDPSFALHYLTESIQYELGEEEKQGLNLFHEFLIKLKIVSNNKSEISYF